MFSLLWRAFWIPLRNILDIIKIFWPLAIVGAVYTYLIPYLIKMLLVRHENFPEVSQLLNKAEGGIYAILVMFLLLFLIIYFVILMYNGLIKWHRHIILEEPAKAINLMPQKRNWRYIGWSFLFAITCLLIHIFLVRKLLPPAALEVPVNPDSYYMAMAEAMLRYTVSLFIFAALLGRRIFVLPKVAVGDSSFDVTIDLSVSEKISWTLTLLTTIAIFMLTFYGLWSIAPIPEFSTGAIPLWLNKSDYHLPLILTIALLFYEGFVMLTLLSLGYKRVVYGE